MAIMRYVILQREQELIFVEMPREYAYQLSALNLRLNKEIGKLTAEHVPALPLAVAECDGLDLLQERLQMISGLHYLQELEASFSALREENYPLISLLTEIRALLAQLEQWYEEELPE